MLWGGSGGLTETSASIPMQEWVHVAYAGSSTDGASFYINGVAHSARFVVRNTNDAPLTIGCANGGIVANK
eukprot:2510869-Rhodomonas_salina.1